MATTTNSQVQEAFARRLGMDSPEGYPILYNHPAQSATTIDGWKSVFFGIPFAAIGAWIGFAAIHGTTDHGQTPIWLVAMIGGMFGVPGLFLMTHGFRGVVKSSIYRSQAAQRPGEPWLYDFHWHAEGRSFSAFGDMLKKLLAAVMWNVFLIPFAWVGFSHRGAWPFAAGTVFFVLIGLVFWYRWAIMALDLVRYGNSFLSYGSFPFWLGSKLSCQLRAPRHVAGIQELTLTLRCVQEKYVETRDAQNRRVTQVVCYERYKATETFDHDRLEAVAEAGIPVEFQLPEDQPPNTLATHPPIYWEVEAKGKAGDGVDYQALFLVPVYKSL